MESKSESENNFRIGSSNIPGNVLSMARALTNFISGSAAGAKTDDAYISL
jgi:hypothetical protein